MLIVDISQRPVIRERTSRSASRSDSELKRVARSSLRPIVLPSSIPDTDSDSLTSDEMSARLPCRRPVTDAALAADAARQPDEERHQRERDQREPPVQQRHRDGRGDDRRRVLGDRRRGARRDVVDAADVVGDARLHLARARAREEGEREPLEVAVDVDPQVVHHALADVRRDVGLHHAQRRGHDRHRRSSRARARSAA